MKNKREYFGHSVDTLINKPEKFWLRIVRHAIQNPKHAYSDEIYDFCDFLSEQKIDIPKPLEFFIYVKTYNDAPPEAEEDRYWDLKIKALSIRRNWEDIRVVLTCFVEQVESEGYIPSPVLKYVSGGVRKVLAKGEPKEIIPWGTKQGLEKKPSLYFDDLSELEKIYDHGDFHPIWSGLSDEEFPKFIECLMIAESKVVSNSFKEAVSEIDKRIDKQNSSLKLVHREIVDKIFSCVDCLDDIELSEMLKDRIQEIKESKTNKVKQDRFYSSSFTIITDRLRKLFTEQDLEIIEDIYLDNDSKISNVFLDSRVDREIILKMIGLKSSKLENYFRGQNNRAFAIESTLEGLYERKRKKILNVEKEIGNRDKVRQIKKIIYDYIYNEAGHLLIKSKK